MVRPELLQVRPAGSDEPNAVEATLTEAADRGAYQRLEFDAGELVVVYSAAIGLGEQLVPGRRYDIIFSPDAIHLLPQRP